MDDARPDPRVPGVREDALPGIGRRYELPLAAGSAIVVVIHHGGRRDVYLRANGEGVSAVLTEQEASELAQVLSGSRYTPTAVQEVEQVVSAFVTDWVTLPAASPAVGRSLRELDLRRTGVAVLGIVRDHRYLHLPNGDEVLLPGDRLVVTGRRSELPAFHRLVLGDG